jgi:hypothetical protein
VSNNVELQKEKRGGKRGREREGKRERERGRGRERRGRGREGTCTCMKSPKFYRHLHLSVFVRSTQTTFTHSVIAYVA